MKSLVFSYLLVVFFTLFSLCISFSYSNIHFPLCQPIYTMFASKNDFSIRPHEVVCMQTRSNILYIYRTSFILFSQHCLITIDGDTCILFVTPHVASDGRHTYYNSVVFLSLGHDADCAWRLMECVCCLHIGCGSGHGR